MKEHLLTLQVLSNKVQQIPTSIVQNDSDTNVIVVTLIGANNSPYKLDGITSIMCKILKENGNIAIINTIEIIDSDNGKIKVILPLLAVSKAGICQGIIELYNVGTRTSTARFSYLVTSDIMATSEQQIDVDTTIQLTTIAQNAISQVEAAKGAIQQGENSRVEAEGQRAANETARVGAESSRASVESSRVTAETARVNAETARASAESTRASSESTRVSNENTRKSNETARASAESSRTSAETTRTNSESSRASAETLRLNEESIRNTAETARINAESSRASNENSRGITEIARVNAESARATAETERASAESTRTTNEAARAVAENARVSNETTRIEAEAARKNAESERVAAEGTRATTFNSQMATIGSKTTTSINGEQANVNFILSQSGETVETLNGKKFASNTDIVKDRTGRTTEQINRVFYKQHCKEFTSTGGDIVVNNGMDGYVLSGVIQGQTVKSYLQSYTDVTTKNWITNNVVKYLSDGYFESLSIYQGRKNTELLDTTIPLKLIMDISTNTTTVSTALTGGSANTLFTGSIEAGFVGRKIFSLNTLQVSRDYLFYLLPKTGEKIIYRFMVVHENDVSKCTGWVDGLASTQAVITNNGLKYSFYLTNEDKLAGRVIDLGGLDGARNTLEIKEDGSAIYTQNTQKYTPNRNDLFSVNTAVTNAESTVFRFDSCPNSLYGLGKIISDKYKEIMFTIATTEEGVCVHNVSIAVPYIRFKNTTLGVLDSDSANTKIDKLKDIVTNNPLKIRYQLATPIVTTIPKELVPVILTQLQNQFKFGEGVAPYSATIQVPCTDDIKKSYDKLVLLNGYTQTVGTATPVVNLLNTGLVRLQMDLTAPSTLLNATLFSVAPELRPVTNAKIPIFVNGVCVLGVVDKTTGNVNLPSIPSANSNIYIKTDYRRDI